LSLLRSSGLSEKRMAPTSITAKLTPPNIKKRPCIPSICSRSGLNLLRVQEEHISNIETNPTTLDLIGTGVISAVSNWGKHPKPHPYAAYAKMIISMGMKTSFCISSGQIPGKLFNQVYTPAVRKDRQMMKDNTINNPRLENFLMTKKDAKAAGILTKAVIQQACSGDTGAPDRLNMSTAYDASTTNPHQPNKT